MEEKLISINLHYSPLAINLTSPVMCKLKKELFHSHLVNPLRESGQSKYLQGAQQESLFVNMYFPDRDSETCPSPGPFMTNHYVVV